MSIFNKIWENWDLSANCKGVIIIPLALLNYKWDTMKRERWRGRQAEAEESCVQLTPMATSPLLGRGIQGRGMWGWVIIAQSRVLCVWRHFEEGESQMCFCPGTVLITKLEKLYPIISCIANQLTDKPPSLFTSQEWSTWCPLSQDISSEVHPWPAAFPYSSSNPERNLNQCLENFLLSLPGRLVNNEDLHT